MPLQQKRRGYGAPNVLCLPTCECNQGRPPTQTGKARAPTKAMPHNATTLPDGTAQRLTLMREYLIEMRDLALRMETVVKIGEYAGRAAK